VTRDDAEVVAALRAGIAALPSMGERLEHSRERFLAELARLPHPLEEDADPTHVTASAIVVGRRGVVLHRHKRMGIWLQPGGHVEPGERPDDAALREVGEETGLVGRHPNGDATIVHVDVHDAPRGHVHLDLRYLVEVDDVDPRPGHGESPDVRWFDWDEAIAVADAGLVRALVALRPPG
jgi:8-oxo-dGTP pyrophosphatase MutT (NUDIX family)